MFKVNNIAVGKCRLGLFPTNHFLIKSFHQPFLLDINIHSGGLLIYIKYSLPAEILSKYKLPSDIQAIHFELNLKKRK